MMAEIEPREDPLIHDLSIPTRQDEFISSQGSMTLESQWKGLSHAPYPAPRRKRRKTALKEKPEGVKVEEVFPKVKGEPIPLLEPPAERDRETLESVRAWYLAEINALKGGLTAGKHHKAASIALEFITSADPFVDRYAVELWVNGKRVVQGPLCNFAGVAKTSQINFTFMMEEGVVRKVELHIKPLMTQWKDDPSIRALHVANITMQPDSKEHGDSERIFTFDIEAAGVHLSSREVRLSIAGSLVLNELFSKIVEENAWLETVLKEESVGSHHVKECSDRLEALIESLYPHFRNDVLNFDDVDWIVEVFTSLASARSVLPVEVNSEETLDLISLCGHEQSD